MTAASPATERLLFLLSTLAWIAFAVLAKQVIEGWNFRS